MFHQIREKEIGHGEKGYEEDNIYNTREKQKNILNDTKRTSNQVDTSN